MFRNPLAAPEILGVTAGASFGAALAIMFFASVTLAIQSNAFIFGLIAVSLAYLLSSRSWDKSASVLVISGIVVSAFFQAGLSILMYVANPYDQLAQIIFWIMGSFHGLLGQGRNHSSDCRDWLHPYDSFQLAAEPYDTA